MQVATLTLDEMREVIALIEQLLTRTPSETDRMDLYQQLATLYSRMLSAQTRELAQDAGLTQLTRLPHGRCCPLTPNLLDPALRHLQQLAPATTSTRTCVPDAASRSSTCTANPQAACRTVPSPQHPARGISGTQGV